MRRRAAVDAALGHDAPERNVMRGLGQARDALHVECDADQDGSLPRVPVAEEVEVAVVKSTTHAEAVAAGIEADEGHQHQVEPSARPRDRRHAIDACIVRRESHAAAPEVRDDGIVDLATERSRASKHDPGIDLAIHCPLGGDARLRARQAETAERRIDCDGGDGSFGRRNGAPCGTHAPAQGGPLAVRHERLSK